MRRAHPPTRAVTDEQRSSRPISAQPPGRQFFFVRTSLLAPYRSTRDMLVARASSARKTPCRECVAISATLHLPWASSSACLGPGSSRLESRRYGRLENLRYGRSSPGFKARCKRDVPRATFGLRGGCSLFQRLQNSGSCPTERWGNSLKTEPWTKRLFLSWRRHFLHRGEEQADQDRVGTVSIDHFQTGRRGGVAV